MAMVLDYFNGRLLHLGYGCSPNNDMVINVRSTKALAMFQMLYAKNKVSKYADPTIHQFYEVFLDKYVIPYTMNYREKIKRLHKKRMDDNGWFSWDRLTSDEAKEFYKNSKAIPSKELTRLGYFGGVVFEDISFKGRPDKYKTVTSERLNMYLILLNALSSLEFDYGDIPEFSRLYTDLFHAIDCDSDMELERPTVAGDWEWRFW